MRTLKLWSDGKGLNYESELPSTRAATDVWESVQSGIIRGSSFKAGVDLKKDVEWSRDGSKEILTIKRFNKLIDVAPTVDPAYTGTDCQAIARSREEWLRPTKAITFAHSH